MESGHAENYKQPVRAIIDKRRVDDSESAQAVNIIGDVFSKCCILIDDVIASGGTTVSATAFLRSEGAARVIVACTHPVLSGSATQRLASAGLDEVIVTDTIPLSPEASDHEKLHVVSVARMIGEAIRRINNEESVSGLF